MRICEICTDAHDRTDALCTSCREAVARLAEICTEAPELLYAQIAQPRTATTEAPRSTGAWRRLGVHLG
jgi:hypothetical protein